MHYIRPTRTYTLLRAPPSSHFKTRAAAHETREKDYAQPQLLGSAREISRLHSRAPAHAKVIRNNIFLRSPSANASVGEALRIDRRKVRGGGGETKARTIRRSGPKVRHKDEITSFEYSPSRFSLRLGG